MTGKRQLLWIGKTFILASILSINAIIACNSSTITKDPVFLNALWGVSGALLSAYFLIVLTESLVKEIDDSFKGKN